MTIEFTISSPYSYSIKKWNLENPDKLKKLIKIIDEIPKPTKTYPWIFFNGHFYYSTPKGKIIACQFNTGEKILKLIGHKAPLNQLYRNNDDQLVSKSIDGKINIWDREGEWVYSNCDDASQFTIYYD